MKFILEIVYDAAMNPALPLWMKIAAGFVFLGLCGVVVGLYVSGMRALNAYAEKREIENLDEEGWKWVEETEEHQNLS